MFIAFGIITFALCFALIEIPPLLKQNKRKELWVFILFLLFATGISLATAFDVDLPKPFDWVIIVYKPVGEFILGLLE